jgi:WD40 repeat protein
MKKDSEEGNRPPISWNLSSDRLSLFNYSYAQVSSFGLPSPTNTSSKPEQRTIKTYTKAPLSALSASPGSRELAVVAGREILKIYSTGAQSQEILNLRAGQKGNMMYSSNDVKWATSSRNLIVSASTSGALLVFDLNRTQSDKLDRTITEHSRAVNRISFNPLDPSVLISASQDGTMKLWDFRTRSKSKHTFDGKSESVRDVQFNPMNANEFAAVFDNGSLQTWDMRNPQQFERKWSAHNGLALTVDWDSTGTLIATGGRDKIIKIWDSKSERRKPLHWIQTIASVARIKWRPGFDTQIASCSLTNDNRIQIWDYNRPSIPHRILDDHDNVVTGILWNDSFSLWSCSKDETFVQHNVMNGYNPSSYLRKNTCSFNAMGSLSCCLLDTSSKQTNGNAFSGLKPELYGVSGESSLADFEPSPVALGQRMFIQEDMSFDCISFAFFAEYFTFDPHNISQTCEWNAKIATAAGQHYIAEIWSLVKLLYSDDFIHMRNISDIFESLDSISVLRRIHGKETQKDLLLSQG